jgi:hypothetical protein
MNSKNKHGEPGSPTQPPSTPLVAGLSRDAPPLSKGARAQKNALIDEVFRLGLQHHRPAFRQLGVYQTVRDTALGIVAGTSVGTLTSALSLNGKEAESGFSTTYYAFSKALWDLQDVHLGTFEATLPLLPSEGPITAALDATMVEKTSPRLFGARFGHNASGPKGIGVQLMLGVPLSHLALIVPTRENFRASAITIGLDLIPGKKKKRKKAPALDSNLPPRRRGRPTKEEAAARAILEPKLPKATDVGLAQMQWLRVAADELGAKDRLVIVATDGAYINKTILAHLPQGVSVAGRARKDARLYAPPSEPGDLYGAQLPTPDEIAKDDAFPVSTGRFYYGGDIRELRYKILPHPVLWRFEPKVVGVLRLILLKPIPYIGPSGKRAYNSNYYVLSNDLTSPVETLIQAVLDRWQIEVLHRELKHDIGLGEDQCRNPQSMARVPSMIAATYALVKVAALRLFGPNREDAVFQSFPRWRQYLEKSRARRREVREKQAPVLRPSAQDILTLLRKELLFRWIKGKSRRTRSK